jgi:hypothetical protein
VESGDSDEEELIDGDGDGLGNDDDEAEDEEEDPVGEDEGDDGAGGVRSGGRRDPPRWILAGADRVLDDCRRAARVNIGKQKQPRLYAEQQTFWIHPRSISFILDHNVKSPVDVFQVRFFFWDPHCLVPQLPCPLCRNQLSSSGPLRRPRRCVDLQDSFWLIGWRYRCHHCRNPKTGRTGSATFRSWDPRILSSLPPSLAADFPARMTHRSAISLPLMHFMRAAFQSGMGAKQFAGALRCQHLRRYDEVQLQFLQALDWRRLQGGVAAFLAMKYEPFLEFENRSDRGYYGFSPSSQWLRDVYDGFIEEHQAELNQHTSMLSAEVCALDHSHKVSTVT